MSTPRVIRTIDELRSLAGQELGASGWLEISQQRIDGFAEVTGDHQWIHVDPARAAATQFGGTIAHGFLTLSLIASLRHDLQEVKLDIPTKMSINYGLNRVRFITPVRVGSRVRLRSKLLSLEPVSPDVYQMATEQTIEIEGEPRPAMVAESLARLYL